MKHGGWNFLCGFPSLELGTCTEFYSDQVEAALLFRHMLNLHLCGERIHAPAG